MAGSLYVSRGLALLKRTAKVPLHSLKKVRLPGHLFPDVRKTGRIPSPYLSQMAFSRGLTCHQLETTKMGGECSHPIFRMKRTASMTSAMLLSAVGFSGMRTWCAGTPFLRNHSRALTHMSSPVAGALLPEGMKMKLITGSFFQSASVFSKRSSVPAPRPLPGGFHPPVWTTKRGKALYSCIPVWVLEVRFLAFVSCL